MRRALWPRFSERAPSGRWLALVLLLAVAAPGCSRGTKIEFKGAAKPTGLRLVRPRPRNMVRVVGQPSFIESYERTSIYPKPIAFIERWIVDIGDKVKKVDVLAKLFAPELVEELETKKAAVVLARERIALAKEVVEVDKAEVLAAEARLSEAEEILEKYEAEVIRWQTEVNRLEKQVARGVIHSHVLFESNNQLKSSTAARDKAKATIKRAKADLVAARARLAKAEVEVRVAEAALEVAQYQERYAQAWVDYLTLTAPFPGVISARNANTFDIVLPTTGDPTAYYLSPDISPSGYSAPIYVVDRLDIVRIFVDIPERDANYVRVGTRATVLARAFRDQEIPATVTRVAWALNMKSRTLRAEIDLRNPDSQLLPGMYAYVNVIIDRPNVQVVPVEALEYRGDQTFCWLYKAGKAVRSELETGIRDDEWVEVTARRPPVDPEEPSDKFPWTPIDGTEQVILGDLSLLVPGARVEAVPATPSAKPAGKTPTPAPGPPLKATGSGRLAASDVPIGNVAKKDGGQ
jgi:HlyD family secretion protein